MSLQGKKILHLSTVDFALMHFVRPLILEQKAQGAEVVAACRPSEYFERLREDGIRMIEVSMARSALPWRQARGLVAVANLLKRERPDILHCHTPIAGFLGRIAGAMVGVPLRIYTVHGFHFHEHSTWAMGTFYRVAERFGAKFGHDHFFVSSEDHATAVKMKIRPAEQLHWVGNGIDLEACRHDERRDALRAEMKISPETLVVGFVGRMVHEKGLNELCEAFRALAKDGLNIHLVFIGGRLKSDDRRPIESLDAILNDPEISQRVTQTGLVDDARKHLSAMDIFVLPSYREGLPVALMEAMAARVPSVATNIRGCRELIEDEKNGLLVPIHDASAIEKAIRRLAEDADLRRRLGEAGAKAIEENYTQEAWLKRHDEAYAQAMAARFPDES